MRSLYVSLLLMSAASQGAQAAVYFDRPSFNAAVSGVVNNDLNSLPLGLVTTVFGVETISTSTNAAGGSITAFGFGFGNALGGLGAGGGEDNFSALIFDFTAPIYAFGFDDLDLTNSNEFANVLIQFVGGGSELYAISEADSDFSTAAFFGYSSSTALDRVDVWSSRMPGGSVGGRANLVDNLAISRVAPVPEPETWAMMVLGFGMTASMLRRRRGKEKTPLAFA